MPPAKSSAWIPRALNAFATVAKVRLRPRSILEICARCTPILSPSCSCVSSCFSRACLIAFYRLTSNSILSTDEIEVSFEIGLVGSKSWIPLSELRTRRFDNLVGNVQAQIAITNKTDLPIYLDLARCSRSGNVTPYKVFYDGTTISQGGSNSSGIGLGILGIGLGSGSSSSTSVTTNSQRILLIPPRGKVCMPYEQRISDYDNSIVKDAETFSTKRDVKSAMSDVFGKLTGSDELTYTEATSPAHIDYVLTYSNSDTFTNAKQIDFTFYVYKAVALDKVWSRYVNKYTVDLKKIEGFDNKMIVGEIYLNKE